MRSLRWRIASWYALLLVAVIVIVGVIIVISFQSILIDQVRSRLDNTMQDIARATLPNPNPFITTESSASPLQALENADNLERWASTTTMIQIDTPHGYPLAKSSNMGGMTFPPNTTLSLAHDRQTHTIGTPRGEFEIADRLFSVNGKPQAIVRVGENLDAVANAFARTRETIAIILIAAALAVVILSVVLASQATRPIKELERAMREIGSERLNRRVNLNHRTDEIGRLAGSFNDLLERLEEAFARERQFISDASHELKTPLTSINANAQMLQRWADSDEVIRRESLQTIAHESANLAGMVDGMLTLAKADSGENIPKAPLSLNAVALAAVGSTQPRAGEKGLTLTLHPGAHAPIISGDENLVRQLITNLIDNAIKFTEAGRVDVFISQTELDAILEVQDSGPGIDPQELPLIFERFYRADKSRTREVPGTGLGLAIVRSIARVHGGRVEAEKAPTGGALFRVRFPRIGESVI